jgi:Protein of unknown function DUF262
MGEITDLEIEDTEESAEDDALPSQKYEIFSYPADTTLNGYKEQWDNGQLVVPDFQREYIWDQVRASKLIESFLLGLPVPPVFLYRAADKKSFLIIDGQQRIRSAIYFLKGLFNDKTFRLKGVSPPWEGKAFEELDDTDRFQIENSVLRAIVIQQTNPRDHSSIYRIFERLNTGGVRLNPMEVRNCVYASEFLTSVSRLNNEESWRKILGLNKPDKRYKDVELLLRVLALTEKYEKYEKPMKGFLNDFVAEKMNKKAADNEPALIQFKKSSELVLAELGEKPFHLRGRLNYSFMDAVFAAVSRAGLPRDLKSSVGVLKADKDFVEAVTYNTSDEGVLKGRLKIAVAKIR